MTFLLPLDALLYTVPVLTAVLAEVQIAHRPWWWYYGVFVLSCGVVLLVRRLWK